MKKALVLGLILPLTFPAIADTYQFSGSAAYISGEEDSADIDGYGFSGIYYLAPVDDSKGPLAEAPFLNHSSFVGVSHTSSTIDFEPFGEQDFSFSSILTRITIENNLIFELSYTDIDAKTDTFGGSRRYNDRAISAGLGAYLSDSTELMFTIVKFDDADSTSYSLDLHSVQELSGGSHLSYDLGTTFSDVEGDNTRNVSGGVTYYPTDAFGIGASYEYSSSDGFDWSTISVSGEYFVTPKFAIGVNASSEHGDSDGDTIGLSARVRF